MIIKYQRSVHYDEQVGIQNLKIFFSSRLCKDSKTWARISLHFIIYCIFYKSILYDCYFTENLLCSLQRDIIAYTFHLITRAMIQFKSLIRERYGITKFCIFIGHDEKSNKSPVYHTSSPCTYLLDKCTRKLIVQLQNVYQAYKFQLGYVM